MSQKNIDKLKKNGVHIIDINNVYIDSDVKIGNGTTIEPGVHIKNGSRIGKNVIIGPNSQISNSIISDDCQIDGAVIRDSEISNNVFAGTNSLIRDGSYIKKYCKIGNLVEVKNSIIGEKSKISHFSYVGDAIVGKNVNIGAGTVTCNYDGNQKNQTVIEDGAFIGAGSMIIAPITIGKFAKTGAGSVVRNNVLKNDVVAGVPAKSIK
ncbi:MAG: hypothetical protein CL741_04345 [Chloroflexi bacterium]|nr:hypothetical protein [Chloroflexota bacterium]MBF06484.1 hypothetical protein [Chloroflexota bacterium]|tara:strand:+ start:878 stop:1501 length:624 start_codon:yes stop_codon:yes gene_type:complete